MTTATTPDTRPTSGGLNGFDTAALQATVAVVREQPAVAKVTFRDRGTWAGGSAADLRTEKMVQAGQSTARGFTARGDHPPALLGADTGPTAGEALLLALCGCICATYAAHATARGVRLDGLEVEVEGDLDLNGFLQLAQCPAGFTGIRARVRVASDADDATLEELRQVTTHASPVYNSLVHPVAVTSTVERAA